MKVRRLFDDFGSSAEAEWLESAKRSLKGGNLERFLSSETWEGISRRAIYHEAERGVTASIPAALPEGAWLISQELALDSPAQCNEALLELLARGQGVANIVLAEEVGDGLEVESFDDICRAFDGVWAEAVGYRFGGEVSMTTLSFFNAWLESKSADKSQIFGCLGLDPLGVLMRKGNLKGSWSDAMDELFACASYCVESLPQLRSGLVNTLPLHEAGADSVTEIAVGLAGALQLVRELCGRGLTVTDAASQIAFTVSVGSDFFMEIAKFRAVRLLWAKVISELGGAEDQLEMRIHARTGQYNKSRMQPHLNLVRGTSEALSAVIGGADSLGVGRFDEIAQRDTEFARRLAVNLQLVLQEECRLGVCDAARGSYYLETLTDQFCQSAWALFQEVETEGGCLKVLTSGWVESRVEQVYKAKKNSFLKRKVSLVGVNCYPSSESLIGFDKGRRELKKVSAKAKGTGGGQNAFEGLSSVEIVERASSAMAEGEPISKVRQQLEEHFHESPCLSISPLPKRRLAEDFESLASLVSQSLAESGTSPAMGIIRIGEAKVSLPRAEFVKDFFGVGGFQFQELVCHKGEESSFGGLDSRISVVAICAGLDVSVEELEGMVAQLRSRESGLLVLMAMKPDENADEYRSAGVDDFVYRGCDLYEVNRSILAQIGIEVGS